MYYNIVVDLSWTICYISAEFACTQAGRRVDFSGMKSVEDAAELLRKVEGNVTTPTADGNPFEYLKKMCPEFTPAIDMIIDFWLRFSDTTTRSRYNYCKHKGKPAYSEIEQLRGGRFMGLYVQNSAGDRTQLASDIIDVQLQFSLNDAISELHQFDDTDLFPYIRELLSTLEEILQPSPFI